MRKNKLKRIIISVLTLFSVFYLLCLIFCTVSVFQMRTLNYSSMGFGAVLAEYNFDFVNSLVEVNYYDYDGTITTHKEDSLSKEQQMELRLACAFSFMPVWRQKYYNPAVCDGDQWELIVSYDEKEKRTYGSNSYPLLYRVAYDMIRSIVDTIK